MPSTARIALLCAAAVSCCALIIAPASLGALKTSECTSTDGDFRFSCSSLLPRSSTSTFDFGRCGSPRSFDVDVRGIYEDQISGGMNPPKNGLLRLRYIDDEESEDENPYVYKINVRVKRHGIVVANYSTKRRVLLYWTIRC